MQLGFSRQIFEKYEDCDFHDPPSREAYCSMQTDGRTDMKPIVAFHNLTNAPRQTRWASFRTSFFLWRAVWKCGNKDYTSEIAGGRWGHDFPSFSCERIRKNVPECLEIDAQLEMQSFFYKIQSEILYTIRSVSQSDHAPGLGCSSRSDPYYPVPPQVRGFELSFEIMCRYCLYSFAEPENPLEVSPDPSYFGSEIVCVSVEWSRVILRYVLYDVRYMKYSLLH